MALRGVDALLRGLLRRRPRLHPLDDHGRVVLAGPQAGRNVRGRTHQLVRQLHRGDRLPNHAGDLGDNEPAYFCARLTNARSALPLADCPRELHVLAIQRLPGNILDLHLQEGPGDKK